MPQRSGTAALGDGVVDSEGEGFGFFPGFLCRFPRCRAIAYEFKTSRRIAWVPELLDFLGDVGKAPLQKPSPLGLKTSD